MQRNKLAADGHLHQTQATKTVGLEWHLHKKKNRNFCRSPAGGLPHVYACVLRAHPQCLQGEEVK